MYYEPGATSLIEMAGDYPIRLDYKSDGRYKYERWSRCTLGYLGYLYGDPNLPVIITAWHCFGFVGTDRTSPFVVNVTFYTPKCAPCRISSLNGFFIPGLHVWGVWHSWPPILYVFSDSALIGVRDPNFFSNAGLKYGYVRRANGFRDLPIIGKLGRYDVKEGDELWMRLGRSDRTVSATVRSLCYCAPLIMDYFKYNFVPVVSCHVLIGPVSAQPGDSGSPVYALEGRRGNVFVRAYGVVSGGSAVNTVVAPIDWMDVKLR